jgi:hypothetical protein
VAVAGWRDSPLARVLGSAASWLLFTLCFTLLWLVSTVVLGLGGSCASGGPYEIAVECPDGVALFAPLSIFGGLAAVVIAVALAGGFGLPLTTWAWPILFCGLGIGFLLSMDVVGLVIGVVFEIMGLAPLLLSVRANPQRVFLGARSATGQPFYEGTNARGSILSPYAPHRDGAIGPRGDHWALALGVPLVAILGGYALAQLWFDAVS